MSTAVAPAVALSRPLIGEEERSAVDLVLRGGGLAQGSEVAAFEHEFAGLVDGRRCIAVSSGTAALHLGLLAAGIGAGDEVIVPSFTFAATANAVSLCGGEPVFVDIDPASFCIDPAAVEAAITPRTAAVIAVHLYGHPAAMSELSAIAARHGLLLVEDAAQAHGATLRGSAAGALGDVAAFSFYPTKNMTTGEGGMVVCDSGDIERLVRLYRNQGMLERYRNEVVGFNARMTDMAAAIGRVQLRRLPGWNDARRANAAAYDEQLRGVATPAVAAGVGHVYHQYTVRSHARDQLLERLRWRGIAAGVYYPVPVHRLPAFAQECDLPHTERAAAEVLSIPVRPDLDAAERAAVIAAVNG